VKRYAVQPTLAMLAQEQSDALTAVCLEKPANFTPRAKLKGTLDDQVRVAGEIQLGYVIFLKMGRKSAGNFGGGGNSRELHGSIITCDFPVFSK